MEDQRKEKRYKENNKIAVEFSQEGSIHEPTVIFATTEDISIGGARIIADEDIPVGTNIKLTISLDRSKQSIVTWASVRWTKKLRKKSRFAIGVKFHHDFPQSVVSLIKHFYGKGIPPVLKGKNKEVDVKLTYP